MARYVLRLEPLASASPESLVAAIGPTCSATSPATSSCPAV